MKLLNVKMTTIGLLLSSSVLADNWTYSSDVDGFTDATTHTAYAKSLSGDGFAVIRCDAGARLDVYFSVGKYIGTKDDYPVRYRIDKGEVKTGSWGTSTDGTAVFVDGATKYDLARDLMIGNQLLLEVSNYRGSSYQDKYPLKGSPEVIGKVLSGCDISLEHPQDDGIGRDIEGVEDSVYEHIERWGDKNTQCYKEMLTSLGYENLDDSQNKTTELYIATQKFMDDSFAMCGTSKATQSEEIYHCKKKERFLFNIYSYAVDKDPSFRETCGQLRTGD